MDNVEYIGTISGSRGFKGEIILKDVPPGFDTIQERSKILVGFSPNFSTQFSLISFNRNKKKAIIRLETINNENDVVPLKEKGVFVDKLKMIRKEKETLRNEIIDCMVYDLDNKIELGKVIDVWYLPGNDVWLVDTEKGELPIPVIDDVIINVDLEKELIEVKLPNGIWDIVDSKF